MGYGSADFTGGRRELVVAVRFVECDEPLGQENRKLTANLPHLHGLSTLAQLGGDIAWSKLPVILTRNFLDDLIDRLCPSLLVAQLSKPEDFWRASCTRNCLFPPGFAVAISIQMTL